MATEKPTLTTIKLTLSKGALFQGDCLALLENMKPDSIDCIFADPPFNLGKDYGSKKFTDLLPDEKYFEWTLSWVSECIRVLKPGGSFFVYHLPKWLMKIGAYLSSQPDMVFENWIAIRMKNGFPIKGRLYPAHYGLLYYSKRGKKHKFHVLRTPSPVCRHCGKLIRDYGGYKKKYPKNGDHVPMITLADVWDDISPNISRKSRPKSVNELPLAVPERAILMSTNRGDLVFDPFAGGGGTLSAAANHDRYWLGIDLADTNFALQRLLGEDPSSQRPHMPEKVKKVFSTL